MSNIAASQTFKLSDAAIGAGYDVQHHQEIDSTILAARAWARAHASGIEPSHKGYWVVADVQTSGVGRRARHWSSPRGNLYSSLIVPLDQQPAPLFQLPIVASLALYEALQNVMPKGQKGPALGLKWPNDVLVNKHKIAGILIEKISANAKDFVIISFGINCAQPPSFTPEPHSFPASCLRDQGLDVSAADLFYSLSDRVAMYLDLWHKASHFDAMRQEWLHLATGLDKPIQARLHDETIVGDFVGLDAWGQLKLKQSDGAVRVISNGDIFYLD